ncbi:MAG: DUF1190 domain-containing protein [Pseudomonadota bacterium]
MKRSSPKTQAGRVTLLGATALGLTALSGCEEEPRVEATFYTSLEQCIDRANAPEDVTACERAFAQAETIHTETGPRYGDLALCEEAHGEGACEAPEEAQTQAQAGGGSVFMPLLMGYMMGRAMSGPSANQAAVTPTYTTRGADGRPSQATVQTPGGARVAAPAPGGSIQTRPSLLRPPATRQPVMTRASARASGGFGTRATMSRGS